MTGAPSRPDLGPEAPSSALPIGVVVVKRRLSGPWASHAVLPVAVLPEPAAAAPWTKLPSQGEDELFYAGAAELLLHPSETGHYRDNLSSGRPSVWVSLRPIGGEDHEIAAVTADPYEGESMAEGIGEIVEPVPMPVVIQDAVARFVAAFHVERPFFKRQRDRGDPDALGRRARKDEDRS